MRRELVSSHPRAPSHSIVGRPALDKERTGLLSPPCPLAFYSWQAGLDEQMAIKEQLKRQAYEEFLKEKAM
eukprot:scaffold11931_cov72-Isochrysis_galbana.AAC.1